MTKKMYGLSNMRLFAIGGALLLAATTLTGCTINLGNNGPEQDSNHSHHNGMMGDGSNSADLSGADIMFAQMMIPHHQQAVDMGTLAETRALSPAVKALAAKIKAAQAPEIVQMKGWLTAADAPMDMGHSMGMGGMLSDADMKQLVNAKGADFDKLYLTGMIAHHEGAIHMAQMVTDSRNPEVKALGDAIVATQTAEITEMKALLEK